MLYFLKKLENRRSVGGSAPKPTLTSIACYSYFVEGVWNANVIAIKKEQKEFRNSINVLLLPLISYFKLCAGYFRKRHALAQISRHRNNYDL